MRKQRGDVLFDGLLGILGLALVIGLACAWITHLVVCFQTEKWGFLIAGAIFFPVAIVHGIGLWFGWW